MGHGWATLKLAWRYSAHERARTLLLIAAVSFALLLPVTLKALADRFRTELMARAHATPWIVGAKGHRVDLILQAVYFRAGAAQAAPAGTLDPLLDSGLARTIPLHARFTAREAPVVGTDLDYFPFRSLSLASGRFHGLLGEAVVGDQAARRLGLRPGDSLLTDHNDVYNLAKSLPVKLRVVGVLRPSDSPDDHAVFVDLRTAWVLEGLGHGHGALAPDASGGPASSSVATYTDITPENAASFHFHGDRATFPLTAVLVLPHDDRSAVILKARMDASPTLQMLSPTVVISELMGVVFRAKAFLDANAALYGVSAAMFLGLVVLLSLRVRAQERQTLAYLGCSRGLVTWLLTLELLGVIATGLLIAVGVALAAYGARIDLLRLLG